MQRSLLLSKVRIAFATTGGLPARLKASRRIDSILEKLGSKLSSHCCNAARRMRPLCRMQSNAITYSGHASAVLKFDKVPDKLPDWWDDEDDEEDTVDGNGGNKGNQGGEGRKGGGGRRGGGGDEGGGGGGPGEGFFAALLAMYTRSIMTAPVRTKAISTSVLAILGDFLAQRIAQNNSDSFVFDFRRSASIGAWGFRFMGPMLHFWYGLLDRTFYGKFAVLGKLLSDQLLFAPFFNGSFIAGVGSLEGRPLGEVAETVKTKLWPSMKANWTLWPAAQLVNFTVIPKTYQIVYVNCVALVWNVILTYISHEDDE